MKSSHRPFAVSSRRIADNFCRRVTANWFSSIIARIAAHAAHRYLGMCFPLFYFIFLFSDKIFSNQRGLDEERAHRLSERLFRPDKNPAVFDDARKYEPRKNAKLYIYLLIYFFHHGFSNYYHPVSSRVTSQTTISTFRALFASLKFQLSSTNELTATKRTYDLSIGELSFRFPIGVTWKSSHDRSSPVLRFPIVSLSLKVRCRR